MCVINYIKPNWAVTLFNIGYDHCKVRLIPLSTLCLHSPFREGAHLLAKREISLQLGWLSWVKEKSHRMRSRDHRLLAIFDCTPVLSFQATPWERVVGSGRKQEQRKAWPPRSVESRVSRLRVCTAITISYWSVFLTYRVTSNLEDHRFDEI